MSLRVVSRVIGFGVIGFCVTGLLCGAAWATSLPRADLSEAAKSEAAGATEASAAAQQSAQEVADLLRWFLAPERNALADTHRRFWADDLVYTTSNGQVRSKKEILGGFENGAPALPSQARTGNTAYSAEDVQVRVYGDSAALTFRLVGRTADGKALMYRNSAMFLRRQGEWRAVTWQATRMPDMPVP